jgi:hypothetical protein
MNETAEFACRFARELFSFLRTRLTNPPYGQQIDPKMAVPKKTALRVLSLSLSFFKKKRKKKVFLPAS